MLVNTLANLAMPMEVKKMKKIHWLTLVTIVFGAHAAHAEVSVFACEPELGALAKELGGSHVKVTVATTALQDPHQIQAVQL